MNDHKLSLEQKTGFVFLLVFAIVTVALGALQMRNTIYNPFAIEVADDGQGQKIALDENIRLQQIDTDLDGINDYEELNFFETSPYIPDTDSDGINDKEEIDAGEDPLCPKGKDCGNNPAANAGEIDVTKDIPPPPEAPPLPGEPNTQLPQAPETTPDLETLVSNPALLRELLADSGSISADQLAQISDNDLISLARQLLAEQSDAPPEALPDSPLQ